MRKTIEKNGGMEIWRRLLNGELKIVYLNIDSSLHGNISSDQSIHIFCFVDDFIL